jgi:hypothetical protein
MLGFSVSERAASRWMRKAPGNSDPAQRWVVFPSNHRKPITAMDFFTVPTLTFGRICCLFVISHDRVIFRTAMRQESDERCAAQQLREALSYDSNLRKKIYKAACIGFPKRSHQSFLAHI